MHDACERGAPVFYCFAFDASICFVNDLQTFGEVRAVGVWSCQLTVLKGYHEYNSDRTKYLGYIK